MPVLWMVVEAGKGDSDHAWVWMAMGKTSLEHPRVHLHNDHQQVKDSRDSLTLGVVVKVQYAPWARFFTMA